MIKIFFLKELNISNQKIDSYITGFMQKSCGPPTGLPKKQDLLINVFRPYITFQYAISKVSHQLYQPPNIIATTQFYLS